jgi:aminoglycoside phosphotransferase (APT) family kinase protein
MDLDSALAGGGGLRGIQRVLSGRVARTALRAGLCELLEPGRTLGSCRLRRAKFRSGRRLSASYAVGVGAQRRLIAATWTPNDTPQEPLAVESAGEAEAIERGLASPFAHLALEVGPAQLRIQVAPFDPVFPQLARVSDPARVPRMLASVGMDRVAAATVRTIRYRPGRRHVLRYDTDRGALFAKCYPGGERGARAGRLASEVADRLAASAAPLLAVRALAAPIGDAIMLYPRVVGEPLSRRLADSRPDPGPQLAVTGAALRTLHDGPFAQPAEGKPRRFASEVRRTDSACQHIHTLLPAIGQRIHAALDRAHELHDELPKEEPTFVHGDLKTDHLYTTRSGVVLIDFDACCVADPALDVGKLLADLQWWHAARGGSGLAPPSQAPFLDAYQAPRERLLRARVYEAVILIRIAAHRVRLFEPRWPERTAHLIGRAEAVLAAAEVPGKRDQR